MKNLPTGLFNGGRAIWIWPLTLIVICLLGGIPFWAARVGYFDPASYNRDFLNYCNSLNNLDRLLTREQVINSGCLGWIPDPFGPSAFQMLPFRRLYGLAESFRWLKLPRLLLLLGLPIISLFTYVRFRCTWSLFKPLLPAIPLLLSTVLSALITLKSVSLHVFVVSLLPVIWLPLLFLAGSFASLRFLVQWANAAAVLICLQLPLLILEATRGLPMGFGGHLPDSILPTRLAGSFIMPNGLGVAVLGLLGFVLAYGAIEGKAYFLFLLALPSVILARAGTGFLGWIALLYFQFQRLWVRFRAVGLITLVSVITFLPFVLQRSDIWKSPLGRIDNLFSNMSTATPLQWLVGQGFHVNSNQLRTLLPGESVIHNLSTDGMPILLLLQGGIFGLISFYGLLFFAWRRSYRSRPFLLAVLLASMTVNITELFPLNFLLALSLNYALLVDFSEPVDSSTLRNSLSSQ